MDVLKLSVKKYYGVIVTKSCGKCLDNVDVIRFIVAIVLRMTITIRW